MTNEEDGQPTAVPARVSIVTLGVADTDRSVAFYRALGWECAVAADDGFRLFRTDGALLTLYPRASLAALTGQRVTDTTSGFTGVTLAINVEGVEEVATVLGVVAGAGGNVLRAATHLEWGGTVGYFTDPDGHVWEVAHNPTMPVGPDGRPQLA